MKFTDYHEAVKTLPEHLVNDETRISEMHEYVVALNHKHPLHVWRKGEGWKVAPPAPGPMKAGGRGCQA